jgi:ABC-type maltose transport system permease subunit
VIRGNFARSILNSLLVPVIATTPVLVLFIIGSKSFIRGLTAGAVKG